MNVIALSWLEFLTLLLSVYVLAESIPAFCSMPQGYQLVCHKAKYVVSAASAMAVAFVVFTPLTVVIEWVLFGLMGNLALFVWPRSLWRFKRMLRELELFLMDQEVHDEG